MQTGRHRIGLMVKTERGGHKMGRLTKADIAELKKIIQEEIDTKPILDDYETKRWSTMSNVEMLKEVGDLADCVNADARFIFAKSRVGYIGGGPTLEGLCRDLRKITLGLGILRGTDKLRIGRKARLIFWLRRHIVVKAKRHLRKSKGENKKAGTSPEGKFPRLTRGRNSAGMPTTTIEVNEGVSVEDFLGVIRTWRDAKRNIEFKEMPRRTGRFPCTWELKNSKGKTDIGVTITRKTTRKAREFLWTLAKAIYDKKSTQEAAKAFFPEKNAVDKGFFREETP